jgi:hypothetical protein
LTIISRWNYRQWPGPAVRLPPDTADERGTHHGVPRPEYGATWRLRTQVRLIF